MLVIDHVSKSFGATRAVDDVSLTIDPGQIVGLIGEKSKLELIKAIAKRPNLLILDEPTSVLTPLESEELFRVMRRIADEGTAVVFISHKIREVIDVATRIVVMRSGKVVAEFLGGADAIARPRGESRADARPEGR